MTPDEILRKPYSWCFVPVYDGDRVTSCTGYIREFPGCIVEGDMMLEAKLLLYHAAIDWIKAAQDLGQDIPEPLGKLWEEK